MPLKIQQRAATAKSILTVNIKNKYKFKDIFLLPTLSLFY